MGPPFQNRNWLARKKVMPRPHVEYVNDDTPIPLPASKFDPRDGKKTKQQIAKESRPTPADASMPRICKSIQS